MSESLTFPIIDQTEIASHPGGGTLPELVDPQFEVDPDLQARNQWLEQQLNPDLTLPEITLHEVSSGINNDQFGQRDVIFTNTDGEQIGEAIIRLPMSEEWSTNGSKASFGFVKTEFAGSGFGRAMYLKVLKSLPLSMGFRSGGLNATSRPVWEWMISNGVAQVDDPTLPRYAAYSTVPAMSGL